MKIDSFESFGNAFIDENHFSHEKTILRGAKFDDLEEQAIKHSEISMFPRMENFCLTDYQNAIEVIALACLRIFSHELFEDQKP